MSDINSIALFKCSSEGALKILSQLAVREAAVRDFNVDMHFSHKISTGSGVTFDERTPIQIFIGTQYLCGQDGISDIDMLESFRVFYHELRHADHKLYKFGTCDKCVSDMRIDYMACNGNSCFYGLRKNDVPVDDYWYNIREIDCEAYAFSRMCELLRDKELFPDIKNTDAVMVEYTNNRLFRKNTARIPFRVSNSYLKPTTPFKSVSEIQDLYEKTIQECALRGNKNYTVSADTGSELSCVLCSGGKWQAVRTWMARQKDGSVRTKTAASVMLKLHPEYKEDLGVTSGEEAMLDFKSLLGIEQPRISRLSMNKAKQQSQARQIRESDEIIYYFGNAGEEFEAQ